MESPYFQKSQSNVHKRFDRNYKHFDVILFSALNDLISKVIVKMFYYISETNEIHTYIYQNIRNILTSTQPTSYCSVIFRKLCNWCLIFQMKIYFSPDVYQFLVTRPKYLKQVHYSVEKQNNNQNLRPIKSNCLKQLYNIPFNLYK